MLNLVLFGPPGAGKGTQSELLAEKLGLYLFETSKILERKLDSWRIDQLKEIHPIMDQGKTAKTVYENIQWILKFEKCLLTGDTASIVLVSGFTSTKLRIV